MQPDDPMLLTSIEERTRFFAPRYKSRLIINDGYTICFEQPRPNAWWRFWTRLLLGWKWEEL